MTKDKIIKPPMFLRINRIEIINHSKNRYDVGRIVTLYKEDNDFKKIKLDFQDEGRTLKIVIS